MASGWQKYDELQNAREQAELAHDTRPLRFFRRFDIVLVGGFCATILGLALIWSLIVVVGQRFDWFERPVLRRVPDARLLANVRDELDHKPIQAAAFHRFDQHLYAVQQGHTVHRYDPATEGRKI